MRKALEYAACVGIVIAVSAILVALLFGVREIALMMSKSELGTLVMAVMAFGIVIVDAIMLVGFVVMLVRDLHYELFESKRP